MASTVDMCIDMNLLNVNGVVIIYYSKRFTTNIFDSKTAVPLYIVLARKQMSYGIKANISDRMGGNKLCVVTISNAYFSSHSSY